ncbi:MAG: Alkaline phosphatase (EC [uncultured Sulfurovum sp.]|uniref:Alkaline phosphatase (EC) n=1 Tax=uncultured Sulfurovum sp. TaxID=269237 RepID=A0A6S6UEW7_9BACT|nr:MAG: Alkaline phosphatase (EC [uncultured Sulfurovum sp.]
MKKTIILSTVTSLLLASVIFTGCGDNNITVVDDVNITGISKLSSYESKKEGGSEIVAFDKTSKRMFITNGADNKLDIVDISTVTTPTLVSQIDLSSYGTGVNSVASKNGKIAVAMENGDAIVGKKQGKGSVIILDANGRLLRKVVAGYLPDMVTFNEDGTKIIVANEGEPNGAYTTDPIGSIGIVTVADGSYLDLDFSNTTLTKASDGTEVRLGATLSNNQAQDIEPEYVTVSGNYAYVTLQENNAMAKVDLTSNSIEYVKSYGSKSYETGNSTIDIEENGKIEMKNFAGLFGFYQPDSIASYIKNGVTYLVTANEGDGREYCLDSDPKCDNPTHIDESKISKLDLADSIKASYENDNDLKVMTDLGKNSDGKYEKLYTYGARSFSIWDDQGDLVWDSGDAISKKVAEIQPSLFNQDDGDIDGRSGNKGAEPEALTIGTIGNKVIAFIGLERQNAILLYDISNPKAPTFISYLDIGSKGDVSPEGMRFIAASESPNGKDLLLVANEMSGSTVVYEINKVINK